MAPLAVKATSIWPKCPDDLVLTFLSEDLEDYRPLDMTNVSPWTELGDLDHMWSKGGKRLVQTKPKPLEQECLWQGETTPSANMNMIY